MYQIRILPLAALFVMVIAPWVQAAGRSVNFGTHLSGSQQVPRRVTPAQGQAIFKLSADGQTLHYKLIVANIENVWGAHIHVAPRGQNGPIAVLLFPGNTPFGAPGGGRFQGVLAVGKITANDVIGPPAGSLAQLLSLMQSGMTYINVHTNDGVNPPNTGRGDFLGGEIRGQIRPIGRAR